jgi:hypothetical protein
MKTRALVLTFLLTTLIVGTASAITINQKNIGPITFQTIGGVPLTAWSALSAFKSALNPITKAVLLYQGIKAIAPSEVATLENNISSTLGYIIPGMELDHSYYPQDWTDPNTPPQTSNTSQVYKFGNYSTSNPSQICEFASISNSDIGDYVSIDGTNIHCQSKAYPNFQYPINTVLETSCATGYTLQNNQCVLNDPASVKWPSDGKPTIMKDLNKKWQNVNKDPDQLNDSGIGTDTITRSGTDQHGNPTQESITSNPDGSTTYTRKSETIDQTTGQPVTNTTNVQMDSQGNVTNITENNQNNTTLNNSTTNIGNGSGTTKLEIPPITVSGNGGKIPPFDKTAPSLNQSMDKLRNGIFNLPFLGPLVQASQQNLQTGAGPCPLVLNVTMTPFSFPWVLHTDVMCQLMDEINPVLNLVMTFIWLTAAFFIIMSA